MRPLVLLHNSFDHSVATVMNNHLGERLRISTNDPWLWPFITIQRSHSDVSGRDQHKPSSHVPLLIEWPMQCTRPTHRMDMLYQPWSSPFVNYWILRSHQNICSLQGRVMLGQDRFYKRHKHKPESNHKLITLYMIWLDHVPSLSWTPMLLQSTPPSCLIKPLSYTYSNDKIHARVAHLFLWTLMKPISALHPPSRLSMPLRVESGLLPSLLDIFVCSQDIEEA